MNEEQKSLVEAIRNARLTWTGGPDEAFDELMANAAAAHLSSTDPGAEAGPAADHLDWLEGMLDEILELMQGRGAKYGPGNIAQFGDYGVLVRLSDKLARLQHSLELNHSDESVEDTWLDIAGYALIGLAWSRGLWPGSEKE